MDGRVGRKIADDRLPFFAGEHGFIRVNAGVSKNLAVGLAVGIGSADTEPRRHEAQGLFDPCLAVEGVDVRGDVAALAGALHERCAWEYGSRGLGRVGGSDGNRDEDGKAEKAEPIETRGQPSSGWTRGGAGRSAGGLHGTTVGERLMH